MLSHFGFYYANTEHLTLVIILPKESQRKTKAAITRKADYNPMEAGSQGTGDLKMFFPNPTSYTSLWLKVI